MMAQPVPHPSTDKRRVKVYELRNNDWFDRGTGFCTAAYIPINHAADGEAPKEPRVIVESEDQPDRVLLETRICKEDGFQKQQETLIVWTEPSNGVDMALSFQEAEGCQMIWKFVNSVQQSIQTPMGPHDDSLSDDLALDLPNPIALPPPELGSLPELEQSIRIMSSSATGREALTKCIMTEDYISRLIPLVEVAEDLESLGDLHRLCNIMKTILLLNDNGIMEQAVSDECVLGVVGAMEYDPDFPTHKANHRQWLSNQGRYKEVVRIQDDQIKWKIHQTYRLQYIKDVVLARILDDPTFSVLNSLIFFNQVDIVQHLQSNVDFLTDLFGIFMDSTAEQMRQKEAVFFIQQCCIVSKGLQPALKQTLYTNFLTHGVLQVMKIGFRNPDVAVRVGATDILTAMVEHDPQLLRQAIYRQIRENQQPFTDNLIEFLLAEADLGIRTQISDAFKQLLDPNLPQTPENMQKMHGDPTRRHQIADPQHDNFLQYFYENSAVKLFKPLLDLKDQIDLKFSVASDGVFGSLNEILCFYVKHHAHRCKFFIMQHGIAQRYMQLISCHAKHLQLLAIKFFRTLIALKDDFWVGHVVEKHVVSPILDVLIQTLPRDNLLCSACLDFFEVIRMDNIKELQKQIVEVYREKLQVVSNMDPFRALLMLYEQTGYSTTMDTYLFESEDDATSKKPMNTNVRGMGEHLTVDPDEEAFWNASDDEDEAQSKSSIMAQGQATSANGVVAADPKPLVDYASDEEGDEAVDSEMGVSGTASSSGKDDGESKPGSAEGIESATDSAANTTPPPDVTPPPERISEKRRREDDDEDELGKLMQTNKRRNSSSASLNSATVIGSTALRKKKGAGGGGGRESPGSGSKKIAISISPSLKLATDEGGGE